MINSNVKWMLKAIAANDMSRARQAAISYCVSSKSEKDRQYLDEVAEKIKKKPEMPLNIKGMLEVEDGETSQFRPERVVVSDENEAVIDKVTSIYKVSSQLAKVGVRYLPSMLLYGIPGTGKTTLARLVSHRLQIPLLTVNFSNVINSLLGDTQKNVYRIFEYASQEPCVLFCDEIDAIGNRRGASQDVGEMSRIVISLMQCIDRMRPTSVLVAATNRYDILDEALVRRFSVVYEVLPPTCDIKEKMAFALLSDVGYCDVDNGLARMLVADCMTHSDVNDVVVKFLVDAIGSGNWLPQDDAIGDE